MYHPEFAGCGEWVEPCGTLHQEEEGNLGTGEEGSPEREAGGNPELEQEGTPEVGVVYSPLLCCVM